MRGKKLYFVIFNVLFMKIEVEFVLCIMNVVDVNVVFFLCLFYVGWNIINC